MPSPKGAIWLLHGSWSGRVSLNLALFRNVLVQIEVSHKIPCALQVGQTHSFRLELITVLCKWAKGEGMDLQQGGEPWDP